jgi:hypothetical protein
MITNTSYLTFAFEFMSFRIMTNGYKREGAQTRVHGGLEELVKGEGPSHGART